MEKFEGNLDQIVDNIKIRDGKLLIFSPIKVFFLM